jgi:hypothetical protein
MITEPLKEEYKTPLAMVRGVFLCENLMDCQSPVKRVTLEDWGTGDTQGADDGDVALPLW